MGTDLFGTGGERKMKEIILASNNPNKLIEMREKLGAFGIQVISQKEAGINIDVEETGTTFEENATLKASTIYDIIKKPVIADDSGLEIDALDGAPGVYSHRFAGENATDSDRVQKALTLLKDVPDEKRTARFRCCICLIDEAGEKHIFNGTAEGKIGYEPIGENGFGYDPIFVYGDKTFAQLTREEKNKVSHRGRAVQELVDFFKKM